MAPSRGLLPLLRTRNPIFKPKLRCYSHFAAAATDPSQKARVFISKSQDPYLNLSIEHYLLQKSPADSTILFLYTNSPCVVIGRNQNPWIEVNLGVLRNEELGVKLVRRRSGGGTVFHDEGNVNYSVICPTPAFNRDKHAEMVVKALKYLGAENARVNERHDIVVDEEDKDAIPKPYKVSGSAYKITRLRSLHHGTCLLSSPNLESISKYLRAPGKPFIKARGVDSVSSPVTNVGISNSKFMKAVAFEFESMYPEADRSRRFTVWEKEKDIPEIAKGVEELMVCEPLRTGIVLSDKIQSDDWKYCQTPQFTFSTENAALSVIGQPTKSAWPSMWSGVSPLQVN
jgi:lipoate-protein ligase A